MAEKADDRRIRFLGLALVPGGWGLVALGGVAITMAINGALLWCFKAMSSSVPPPAITSADFGAIFGFSSALFTGLAFAGLIVANLQQRQEIDTARKELAIAQGNQTTLNKQLEDQNRESKKKAFEDTFFRMLQIKDELTSNIGYSGLASDVGFGSEAFLRALAHIAYLEPGTPQEAISQYENLYREHMYSSFGHYFRWLFSLVQFIDKSDIDNKYFYARLVRSQMSDQEASFLLFDGLSEFGRDFKSLICEYSLLNNSSDELTIFEKGEWKKIYGEKAFT